MSILSLNIVFSNNPSLSPPPPPSQGSFADLLKLRRFDSLFEKGITHSYEISAVNHPHDLDKKPFAEYRFDRT